MAFDFATTRTDRKKETDGIWIEGPDDSRFLIARWMNPNHRAFVAKNGAKVRAGAQAGVDVTKESLDLTYQAMANCIVLKWENVALDGAELPHSVDNVLRLLKEVPQAFEIFHKWSDDISRFREDAIAAK